jgi:hypothetical protein
MFVFARKTTAFDPAALPLVPFERQEDCRTLLDGSSPGDVLLLVGSVEGVHLRGTLLGLAEFGRNPIPACWPGNATSLPILRAWSFETKLKLIDTLSEHLTFSVKHCVRLSDQDTRTVLALPRRKIELPVQYIQVGRRKGEMSRARDQARLASSGFYEQVNRRRGR